MFWESVWQKFTQQGGHADFLRPFIWIHVSGLILFRDESDNECAWNVVLNSGKVRWRQRQWLDKRWAKKAWAVHGKSKLTDTENCKIEIIRPGRPNGYFRILLWRFTETAWKCAKTSPRNLVTKQLSVESRQRTTSHFLFQKGPRNLVTKQLSVESRQRTTSHFLFQKGIFSQKQHDCQ
jgi:hypothetical protein